MHVRKTNVQTNVYEFRARYILYGGGIRIEYVTDKAEEKR